MYERGVECKTLEEHRQLEMALHLELMNVCKKYISGLGIVSILGILDIVNQEVVEFEKATKHDVSLDRTEEPQPSQPSQNQGESY